jgi:hypothetical protein
VNERSDTGGLGPGWQGISAMARALLARGGGEPSAPRPLTARERATRKRRRQQARQSRRANRKEKR